MIECYLNNNYRPTLCITGIAGIPDLANAGNVLRTHTEVVLSLRLPPGVDVPKAEEAVERELTRDPPYNAIIKVDKIDAGSGFQTPEFPEWLENAMNAASQQFFGKDFMYSNAGGSIPLLYDL